MQDLAFAIPGVDEAMGFAEIMKYVASSIPLQSDDLTYFLQTRPIHAIFCHRLRHRTDGTHTPLSLLPLGAREGVREAQLTGKSVWSND